VARAGDLITELWPAAGWVALVYLAGSVVAFVMYAVDKAAAQRRGRRRIPERTLLMMAVVGGWPGSIVAQQTLRHKTQKRSFRRAFWAAVALNLLVLAALAVAATAVR
jgi:uncharacterized membrane protein YsdA (DUF1294 family)